MHACLRVRTCVCVYACKCLCVGAFACMAVFVRACAGCACAFRVRARVTCTFRLRVCVCGCAHVCVHVSVRSLCVSLLVCTIIVCVCGFLARGGMCEAGTRTGAVHVREYARASACAPGIVFVVCVCKLLYMRILFLCHSRGSWVDVTASVWFRRSPEAPPVRVWRTCGGRAAGGQHHEKL